MSALRDGPGAIVLGVWAADHGLSGEARLVPGFPQYRKFKNKLEKAGGVEHVLARLGDGETLSEIMQGFGVSRWMWYTYCKRNPAIAEQYRQGRKELSHAYVDQATVALRDAPVERAAVSKAVALADHYRWLAQVTNREDYGKGEGGVNISIGSLHLDALRAREVIPTVEATPAPLALPPPDVDVEAEEE